nr:substrate-binding domain-containing protein [Anaerotalea alkaliphila]
MFPESGSGRDDGKILIGLSADSQVIERWQRDQEIFLQKATDLGASVIVHNANEDNEVQVAQIRTLVRQKVDVIVVIPYDKDGVAEAVNDAKKAGIKVVAYDRLVNNADLDAYVSFDQVKVGRLMAQALVAAVPEGNIAVANGSPEDNNTNLFRQGYMEVLQPLVDRGSLRIIGETWARDWREEHAYALVSGLLDAGLSIHGVVGANDRLAEAAIRALAERGMAGKVPVVGHDADVSACQRIVEGTQLATVYKPIPALAERAALLAVDLARGGAAPQEETIFNGRKEVPYVKLDVVLVTKENMRETVIADGFHREEDIYRQ